MFKFALKRVCKNIKFSLGQIIRIMLSTLLIFTVISLGNTISNQYRYYLVSGNPIDFKITDLDKNQTELFNENFSADGKIISVKSYLGFIDLNSSSTASSWLTSGTNNGLRDTEHIEISEGKFPENDFEIAIEEYANSLLPNPFLIGDEITSDISGGKFVDKNSAKYTFTVTGLIKDTGIRNVSSGQVTYAVISNETAEIIATENGINAPFDIEVVSNSDLFIYDTDIIFDDINNAKSAIYPEYSELVSSLDNITEEQTERIKFINNTVKFNQEKSDLYESSSGLMAGNIIMHINSKKWSFEILDMLTDYSIFLFRGAVETKSKSFISGELEVRSDSIICEFEETNFNRIF